MSDGGLFVHGGDCPGDQGENEGEGLQELDETLQYLDVEDDEYDRSTEGGTNEEGAGDR